MRNLGTITLIALLLGPVGCRSGEGRRPAEDFPLTLELPTALELTSDERREGGRAVSLKGGGDSVFITAYKGLEGDHARNFFNDKRLLMDSLYMVARSPYPGLLTSNDECPKEFQPVIHKVENDEMTVLGYEVSANKRFVFGGCTNETSELAAAYILVHCHELNMVAEVRFFTPAESLSLTPRAVIDSVGCP